MESSKWEVSVEEEVIDSFKKLKIEEHTLGDYGCPKIILLRKEEQRITGPWKEGVLVKMIGRRIWYKALENRLNQMWERKGGLNIMDLGQGYYLVTFNSEKDQYVMLMDDPWLIYDHHLLE